MMFALLALFAALQLIDLWTTLRAFDRNPAAYEANPALRWLMRRLGPLPALVGVKLAVGGVMAWMGLTYPRETLALVIVGASCAAYVAVVVNNWRVG